MALFNSRGEMWMALAQKSPDVIKIAISGAARDVRDVPYHPYNAAGDTNRLAGRLDLAMTLLGEQDIEGGLGMRMENLRGAGPTELTGLLGQLRRLGYVLTYVGKDQREDGKVLTRLTYSRLADAVAVEESAQLRRLLETCYVRKLQGHMNPQLTNDGKLFIRVDSLQCELGNPVAAAKELPKRLQLDPVDFVYELAQA